ncbi:hypothetical protein JHK86_025448 [Glycine max]|nr:hypothetical protein JHK86_025448 [Glycine max]
MEVMGKEIDRQESPKELRKHMRHPLNMNTRGCAGLKSPVVANISQRSATYPNCSKMTSVKDV